MARISTTPGELARRGFNDARMAAKELEQLWARAEGRGGGWALEPGWTSQLERVADPDLALAGLNRLDEQHPQQLARAMASPQVFGRLLAVLGGSHALNQHLCTHPADLVVLEEDPGRHDAGWIRAELRRAIGADPEEAVPVAAAPEAADRLRVANRTHLVRLAMWDLTHPDPPAILDQVAAELADLADAVVDAALAIARSQVPGHERARLGVVAMGKCGAQELNYISDVDVVFVAEPADEAVESHDAVAVATRVAAAMSRICSANSSAGSIWQVDANLRPEGKQGALVRSLAAMGSYYDKWAKNWEFQAMLKARAMAGDLELAQQFVDMVQPHVWQAAEREHFLADTQAMRQRVISLLPPAQADREIKLGAGGLRDVEFSVQLLQLVHGRADERLRTRATLTSLDELVAHGYIGRKDGAEMAQAYRFQRTLEHRVQLYRLRRTHLLPDDPDVLRVVARSMGMRSGEELVAAWRASARTVLRLHQRVFYSPLLAAVTRISTDEMRLTPDQARDRLRVLGFADPAQALRHMEALTTGTSRSVDIQRQLMPAMLGWFAEGANPDHGLLSFRQVSESLGTSPWYLRALRDEGQMAERLARILSSSRYAVDLLKRAPSSVRLLASEKELAPRSREELAAAMASALKRHPEREEAIAAVRGIRREELLRLVAGDILDVLTSEQLGRGLSDLAGATIDAALAVAARDMADPPTLGVVAMGRWGGGEMGLGSDCDAMFVMADSEDEQALKKAGTLISQLRQMLGARGPDPALDIDVDLRPEGRSGPMVRSLSSYRAYYQRWSVTWEQQALLRAAHGAGDAGLTAQLLELVAPLRYPAEGLSRGQLAEIRKLKARMETERIPRGTDPRRNTKLGPGGLSDGEWTVQVLQLQHAHRLPQLRTTGTLQALAAAREAGLVEPEDARAMAEAWRFASRVRNKIMLVRGRPSDVMPTDARETGAVATLLGYGPGQASVMKDDHRRLARHAVQAVDRLFWDGDGSGR